MNSTVLPVKNSLCLWQNVYIENNHYQEHLNISKDTVDHYIKKDESFLPIMNIINLTLAKILSPVDDLLHPNNHLVLKNGGIANNLEIGAHSYVYVGKGTNASDVKVGDYAFVFLVGKADHKQHKVGNFSRMSCLIADNETCLGEIKTIENRKFIKFQLTLLKTITSNQKYQEMVTRGQISKPLMTDFKAVTSGSFDKYQQTVFDNLTEFNEYLDKFKGSELR